MKIDNWLSKINHKSISEFLKLNNIIELEAIHLKKKLIVKHNVIE